MTLQAADDSDTWREKYLDALDVQEALEHQLDEQYQRLRRAVVQLSVVADGQDRTLDDLLDQLRKLLRGDQSPDPAQLAPLTEQLDRCVRSYEQRREVTDAELLTALTALVKQLLALGPNRELKRELTHYLSRLPMRSQKFSLFPALLQQLADLQQQVITQSHAAKPGLLGRLRGDRGTDSLPPNTLCAEISQVLEGLMGAVNTEYMGPEVLEGLLVRIKQGLTLNELPGFLEEVRDLILHSWLAANQVFANYLNSVNRELEEISTLVAGAVTHHAKRSAARQDLTEQMEAGCESLANSVESARDLTQLKTQVASQLGQIRESLSQFRHSEEAAEPLTSQLEQLASRVQQMEQEAEQNQVSLRRHRHKALHDSLTQLPNREAYDERLVHEVARWQRYGHPLTLAVCDVDHFKRINDQFGHQAGDRVLKVISRAISRRLREVDFFGRYGGEEFVILMPETHAKDALLVLDDVRAALADAAFNYRKEPLTITISMGLSEFREGDTADQVFGRADQALYAAKAAGRNRCQIG